VKGRALPVTGLWAAPWTTKPLSSSAAEGGSTGWIADEHKYQGSSSHVLKVPLPCPCSGTSSLPPTWSSLHRSCSLSTSCAALAAAPLWNAISCLASFSALCRCSSASLSCCRVSFSALRRCSSPSRSCCLELPLHSQLLRPQLLQGLPDLPTGPAPGLPLGACTSRTPGTAMDSASPPQH